LKHQHGISHPGSSVLTLPLPFPFKDSADEPPDAPNGSRQNQEHASFKQTQQIVLARYPPHVPAKGVKGIEHGRIRSEEELDPLSRQSEVLQSDFSIGNVIRQSRQDRLERRFGLSSISYIDSQPTSKLTFLNQVNIAFSSQREDISKTRSDYATLMQPDLQMKKSLEEKERIKKKGGLPFFALRKKCEPLF
jgi:hypothetical protein